MWEIFTCGKVPYGRATNAEVVEQVQRGQRLDVPRACPWEVYTIMKSCWEEVWLNLFIKGCILILIGY